MAARKMTLKIFPTSRSIRQKDSGTDNGNLDEKSDSSDSSIERGLILVSSKLDLLKTTKDDDDNARQATISNEEVTRPPANRPNYFRTEDCTNLNVQKGFVSNAISTLFSVDSLYHKQNGVGCNNSSGLNNHGFGGGDGRVSNPGDSSEHTVCRNTRKNKKGKSEETSFSNLQGYNSLVDDEDEERSVCGGLCCVQGCVWGIIAAIHFFFIVPAAIMMLVYGMNKGKMAVMATGGALLFMAVCGTPSIALTVRHFRRKRRKRLEAYRQETRQRRTEATFENEVNETEEV